MVGDTVDDDGAAAHLGMRTLILPRTRGTTHGLEQVLRLVG
jgi:FMN phosphatase YigB (HAD superfamily)